MTNYHGIAEGLAKRCEAVGWPVRRSSTGYRVTFPDKSTTIIHITPKGDGYYRTVDRKLKEHGLYLLEEQQEELRKQGARERADEDAKSIAARLEKAQRENAALLRASYAGLPFTDDPTWATTPYETMQPPKVMLIQPGWTQEWLDNLNVDNRPRSKSEEDLIANELTEGRYKLTHQAIAFDTRGYLQDGQTRMWGIRKSGVAAPMWVFTGMPVDNFDVLDTGRKRNANNGMDRIGFTDNRPQRTAFARLILAFRDGSIEVEHRSRYSTSQILALWKSDIDGFDTAFRRGIRIGKGGSGLVYSAAGAGVYLLGQSNSKPEVVEEFLDGIETGAGLPKGDPRLALRNYLTKNNPTNRGQLALMMTAWNQWLKGEVKQTYQWSATYNFPRISIAK